MVVDKYEQLELNMNELRQIDTKKVLKTSLPATFTKI